MDPAVPTKAAPPIIAADATMASVSNPLGVIHFNRLHFQILKQPGSVFMQFRPKKHALDASALGLSFYRPKKLYAFHAPADVRVGPEDVHLKG
jgi:hypothetical protein